MSKPFKKSYDELVFSDDYMFCTVMEDYPEICKEVIEILIGDQIGKINVVTPQKAISNTFDAKSVRLDMMVEAADGTIYDVEMQTTDEKNIGKRSRYYQSVIDGKCLARGEEYESLPKSFIIFVCKFDPFKKGKDIYTFKMKEICDDSIELQSESTLVVACADGKVNDKQTLGEFLNFVSTNISTGSLTRKIAAAVADSKLNSERRHLYMTFVHYLNKEKAESLAEGRKKMCIELYREGSITAECAAKKLNITVEEFKKLINESN